MAILYIEEKIETADRNGFTIPVFFYDDNKATITLEDIIAEATAVAEQLYSNALFDDLLPQQLSNHSWRVQIKYLYAQGGLGGTTRSAQVPWFPAVGDKVSSFRYQMKPIDITLSKRGRQKRFGGQAAEPIVNHIFDGEDPADVPRTILQPPAINHMLKIVLSIAQATPAYLTAIQKLQGKMNADAYMINGNTFAAGELLVVSMTGGRVGQTEAHFSVGFASKPNITNEEVPESEDEIGLPIRYNARGHDYVWMLDGVAWDNLTDSFHKKIRGVFVEEIFDEETFGGVI